MPDPTAFSKGFESTLQYGVELFAKQKKEKEDLAEKAEQAESILLSATDLGGYKDLDKKIYDSFQNNIRGIVDAGEFAKATPARKQEMLEQIRNLKQGFEKLQSVISTPADEIDARNEDVLKLKLQLAEDPTKIKVIGSGANMSLVWSGAEGEPTNEISVSGLTSKRIINIKQFEEPLRKFDSDLLKSSTAEMINGAKLGRYDDAKNVARATYSTNLQSNLTDEQYAYIYTNKLKPSEKWQATPEQKEAVLAYKQKEFEIKLDAQDPRAKLYEPLPPVDKPTEGAIKRALDKNDKKAFGDVLIENAGRLSTRGDKGELKRFMTDDGNLRPDQIEAYGRNVNIPNTVIVKAPPEFKTEQDEDGVETQVQINPNEYIVANDRTGKQVPFNANNAISPDDLEGFVLTAYGFNAKEIKDYKLRKKAAKFN